MNMLKQRMKMKRERGALTGIGRALCCLLLLLGAWTPSAHAVGFKITSSTGATLLTGTTDIGLNADNATATVALPFPVTVYGTVYNSVRVSSNGNLQFTGNNIGRDNQALPDTNFGVTLFPYFDDLTTAGAGNGVFTQTLGATPNQIFVIEWRAAYSGRPGTANFEVRFNEGSPIIETAYGTNLDNGTRETVGIQQNSTNFDQFSYLTPSVPDGTLLTFTPLPILDLNSGTTGNNTALTFTEGNSATAIAPNLTLFDDNSPTITSATVTLTNHPDGNLETLAVTNAMNLASSYNSNTGVLTLFGTASRATYRQVLASVTYNNTSVNPNTAQRLITYVVNDGANNASNKPQALVNVVSVNTPPSNTVPAAQITNEDTPITFNTANGNLIKVNDADNPVLTVTLTVTNGTLSLSRTTGLSFINGDGTDDVTLKFAGTIANLNAALSGLVFTPTANYHGAALLTILSSDSTPANDDTDTVAITINTVNDAPVASDGSINTDEDTAVSIDLRALVSDVETSVNNLTYTITPPAANQGTLVASANNGVYTFTPAANFNGASTFTYQVTDNGDPDGTPANALSSAIKTVTVTVNAVNDAPTITAIANQSTNEDTSTSAIAFTIGDVENAPNNLAVSVVSSNTALVPNSRLVLTGSGANRTLTISPLPDANGSTTITVSVSDGTTQTSTSFTLQVLAVSDAPVAYNANIGATKNTAQSIVLVASDIDSPNLAYTLQSQPTHGTLSGTAPNLIYTPAIGYIGGDSFTFKVNDGALDSNTATVTITVGGQNGAPTAVADNVTTPEDTPIDIDVIANDSDADGNSIRATYVLISPNTHGSATLLPNGKVRYVPDANFTGTATFIYNLNDGQLDSTGTVTVQVLAVNDAPVADAQTLQTNDETPKGITLTGSDVDNTSLTFAIVRGPQHGQLTGTAPNLVYTPELNFSGTDDFIFAVSDGTLSANATVSIVVTQLDSPPVANNDRYPSTFRLLKVTAAEGVLVNDTDVDTPVSGLRARVVVGPTKGTLVLNADGSFVYTPFATVGGYDDFSYVVNDGRKDSNIAHVDVGASAPVDVKAPSVIITTPRERSVAPNFGTIMGLASDGPDGSGKGAIEASGVRLVQVLLLRLSDNFAWNGRNFTPNLVQLTAVYNPRTRVWRLATPLPTSSDLRNGTYQIVATASDNAGNRARASAFVNIQNASTPPPVAQ